MLWLIYITYSRDNADVTTSVLVFVGEKDCKNVL